MREMELELANFKLKPLPWTSWRDGAMAGAEGDGTAVAWLDGFDS